MSARAWPASALAKGWRRLGLAPPAPGRWRPYAVLSGGAPRFQVFNRRAKWLQKERAAAKPDESRLADYLKDEVAVRLTERLLVSCAGRRRACSHG